MPAAGVGERLGAGVPKALRLLAGEPLIVHAVRALVVAGVETVVVASPADTVSQVEQLLGPVTAAAALAVVPGGLTRRESVAACLAALPDDAEVVLVHDAARPLVPEAVVRRVLGELANGAEAVVPAVRVADTVKEVTAGHVVRTVDRSALRAVQTPQGFRRAVLARAHADWRGPEPSDDAAMIEALGVPVRVVDGAAEGFKITGPLDLRLAQIICS